MQATSQKKKEFITALAEVIYELRKNSNRSARSIAYETEMSKTTLLLAEKGKLDPQLTTFCKIAEAFYVSPIELLKLVYKKLPDNWSFIEDYSDVV